MSRGTEKNGGERLLSEYTVEVYTSGRVEWGGLDLFLRRNPGAWRELESLLRGSRALRGSIRASEGFAAYQPA